MVSGLGKLQLRREGCAPSRKNDLQRGTPIHGQGEKIPSSSRGGFSPINRGEEPSVRFSAKSYEERTAHAAYAQRSKKSRGGRPTAGRDVVCSKEKRARREGEVD